MNKFAKYLSIGALVFSWLTDSIEDGEVSIDEVAELLKQISAIMGMDFAIKINAGDS